MTHPRRSTKTLAIATMLAMLVTGCAAMLAGPPTRLGPAPQLAGATSDTGPPSAAAADEHRADQSRIRATLGKLPVYFVHNRGQEDPRVAYYVQGSNTAVYFANDGITFALSRPTEHVPGQLTSRVPVRLASTRPERAAATERPAAMERWAVKLDFVGANRVAPTGDELAPAVVSYFRGHDQHPGTTTESYRGVTYRDLWPGIDLVYSGAGGQLKSTFIVKPGADPSRVRLAYRGATGVKLTDAGQLEVSTPVGSFADDRPYAYQEQSGRRTEVPVAFMLAAATDGAQGYGFTVGVYDKTQTLVVDPTLLVYAGFIGGAGNDNATGIALDAAGNAYVVGTTDSATPSFPAKVGPDLAYNGGNTDVFVAKVKADGSDLLYLGYIGGDGDDVGTAIAVDTAGNAYVTGYTTSLANSFPVLMGPDLSHNGGYLDAFVAKVKADGTGLVYCGFIGGAAWDLAYGIDVDTAGNAYVTGYTKSDETSFPVKLGPDLVHGGGEDAFVAKVKADGTGLVYAGYIGGVSDDRGYAIAVDLNGYAYVTGMTASDHTTFPVKVGPDLKFNGVTDAFVAKVKADGTGLVYAGYVGGAHDEWGNAIALDAAGNAYITGYTASDEGTFPVKVGPDLKFNGYVDAFVAKVKADGTALIYAGYIGGTGEDVGNGIVVDSTGIAYVTGYTYSSASSFPVWVGPSTQLAGGSDAFVAKIKTDGSGLMWAGYIGGTGQERGNAIAVDVAGNVYIAGSTTSSDGSFPVTVGPDLLYGGGYHDAFVAKVSAKPDLIDALMSVSTNATKPGGTIAVADLVGNWGLGTAKPSTTRYYLSTDTVKSLGDILLGGGRSVPSLLPGAIHVGSATVTVPTTTALGAYRVIACADDPKAVPEADETDNCLVSSTTVQVTLPELLVVGVSNPPATVQRGHGFTVSDSVENFATVGAGPSTTRYYLSKDSAKGGDILLTGSRSVAALGSLAVSTGTVTVTVPALATPGVYHLLACADDFVAVKELNETNNCISAANTVTITQ